MAKRSVVIVGGTSGLGLALARRYAELGRSVVISGRDRDRATAIAEGIDAALVTGLGFDLAEPATIAPALADLGAVDRLAIASIERDENTIGGYDVATALRLTTLKLVGYMEVVHALASRLADDASILLFGGLAKLRPYPGSTTVTTVNAGVDGIVRTLVSELAPVRVNALHPGIVADTPNWESKTEALQAVETRTPTGRLVTMADVVQAAEFLWENEAMNGADLRVDGGWSLP
jgi:NAD(P)-dependent dehydrogenase (short-subunit alcohol dehydrogenase family)